MSRAPLDNSARGGVYAGKMFILLYSIKICLDVYKWTWGPFLEGSEGFRTQKAIAKDQTLWLQSIFIRVSLKGTEVPFIQEVLGVYTCPFLRSAHTMGLVPATSPCNESQGLVASCELATSPCD